MKTLHVNNDILLKEIQLEDAIDIYNTIDSQRNYLGEWLPFVAFTNEVKDTEAFIHSLQNTPEEERDPVFVIHFKGEFVGLIGCKDTDHTNHKIEIGYWLSEDYQGKGIMMQSIKVLIDFIFTELNMNRIQIKCAVENNKSIRIPEKLGFHFEGIERAGELLTGEIYTDLNIYSLLFVEWRNNH